MSGPRHHDGAGVAPRATERDSATADGHCETQTVLFLPRGGAAGFARLARAAPALGLMLREDNRILDSISFSPGYTENDAGLREFARVVDAMEVW